MIIRKQRPRSIKQIKDFVHKHTYLNFCSSVFRLDNTAYSRTMPIEHSIHSSFRQYYYINHDY